MSTEKKSKRTVNSSSNEQLSSSSSQSKETKDAHPTAQKLVYFATESDPISTEKKEVKNYIEKLIAGQISGETHEVEVLTSDGKTSIKTQVRRWKHVTPYPIEFVDPATDMKSLMFAESGEQFIQAFQSDTLRAQLKRRSYGGPNLVHGWLFNFDGVHFDQWPREHADEVVEFGLKIIRQEEATWACMSSIYQLPFDVIKDIISGIQQNGGLLPLEYTDDVSHPLMSEIARLVYSEEEKVDWVELYDRWLQDVVTVVDATTSPPTSEQQWKMALTLRRVLGSDNARLVQADLQRCLRPKGKRQNLIPADFRYLFDFAYKHSWVDRMFLAQCLLRRLVQDSGDWNQRYWTISSTRAAKGNDSLTFVNPGSKVGAIAFRRTGEEASLPGDDPVAMWQMTGPGVKKVIAGILEYSPQLRKDRLVGNVLNKQLLQDSIATRPIQTLSGWKRFAPGRDSKTGQLLKVTPGTAQMVMSYLGKAQDTPAALDNDDDNDASSSSSRVVRFNSDVITTAGHSSGSIYDAPFVRAKTKKLLS